MFNTVDDLYESLMNQLKDRIATTKTITTLFICGVLLVGFGTVSLSFSQSAMAQQGPPEGRPPENPQCPPGYEFNRGECTTEVCPPETDIERDGKCFIEVEEELEKICPPETDIERDGKCFIEVEREVQKVPGACPTDPQDRPTLPISDSECRRFNEAANQFVGPVFTRPQVCPPETDIERDGKCFVVDEVEVQKICPPETDIERDGKCFEIVEEEVPKIPVTQRPGRGNA